MMAKLLRSLDKWHGQGSQMQGFMAGAAVCALITAFSGYARGDGGDACAARGLLISAGYTALSVNLTMGLVCRPACSVELTSEARIPAGSYAFLRTAVADQAFIQSRAWAVRLTSD